MLTVADSDRCSGDVGQEFVYLRPVRRPPGAPCAPPAVPPRPPCSSSRTGSSPTYGRSRSSPSGRHYSCYTKTAAAALLKDNGSNLYRSVLMFALQFYIFECQNISSEMLCLDSWSHIFHPGKRYS